MKKKTENNQTNGIRLRCTNVICLHKYAESISCDTHNHSERHVIVFGIFNLHKFIRFALEMVRKLD